MRTLAAREPLKVHSRCGVTCPAPPKLDQTTKVSVVASQLTGGGAQLTLADRTAPSPDRRQLALATQLVLRSVPAVKALCAYHVAFFSDAHSVACHLGAVAAQQLSFATKHYAALRAHAHMIVCMLIIRRLPTERRRR